LQTVCALVMRLGTGSDATTGAAASFGDVTLADIVQAARI